MKLILFITLSMSIVSMLVGCYTGLPFGFLPTDNHRWIGSLRIQDPAPVGTNCTERAQEMMWLVHLYDAESVPHYPGLPVEVTPTEITVNDDHCEYRGVIQVNVPGDWPTMEWFVLAMDETEWVAQCETQLFKLVDDQPVPLGPITFVRGEADCSVENS